MGRKLRWTYHLFEWIRSLSEPKVNPNSIDKSGVVFSDHPVVGKGWIKGWVSDKDEIYICKHANPVIANFVHVMKDGEKITRKISYIDNTYASHDIAICKLSEPWPEGVKIYKRCRGIKKMQKLYTLHQDKTFSTRRALFNDHDLTVFGTYYERSFIGGDSGLPWFVFEDGEFKVCSHTKLGMWGVGPNYSKIL